MIDSPEVVEAYRADKDETRKAEGSAAELQGKTATTDGPVRFTAPSIVFEQNGTKLVAGGFQPVEAYDILVANIDPTASPRAAAGDPGAAARAVQRRPDHAGGRGADGGEQRGAGPRRRRGRAARARRSPATRSVIRSATTPCGSRRRPPSRWRSTRLARSQCRSRHCPDGDRAPGCRRRRPMTAAGSRHVRPEHTPAADRPGADGRRAVDARAGDRGVRGGRRSGSWPPDTSARTR